MLAHSELLGLEGAIPSLSAMMEVGYDLVYTPKYEAYCGREGCQAAGGGLLRNCFAAIGYGMLMVPEEVVQKLRDAGKPAPRPPRVRRRLQGRRRSLPAPASRGPLPVPWQCMPRRRPSQPQRPAPGRSRLPTHPACAAATRPARGAGWEPLLQRIKEDRGYRGHCESACAASSPPAAQRLCVCAQRCSGGCSCGWGAGRAAAGGVLPPRLAPLSSTPPAAMPLLGPADKRFFRCMASRLLVSLSGARGEMCGVQCVQCRAEPRSPAAARCCGAGRVALVAVLQLGGTWRPGPQALQGTASEQVEELAKELLEEVVQLSAPQILYDGPTGSQVGLGWPPGQPGLGWAGLGGESGGGLAAGRAGQLPAAAAAQLAVALAPWPPAPGWGCQPLSPCG